MGSIGIAIPHTDKEHVIKGAVAIGVLKEPVHFYQMGTNDENVSAKLIFYACSKRPERASCISAENSYDSSGSGSFGKIDEDQEQTGNY